MCFQRSSERIEGKSRPPQSGWKIVPQSRTGCRETPVTKFVVCSWHEQLPDVVMMLVCVCVAGDSAQTGTSLVFYISVSCVCATIIVIALSVFLYYVRSRRPVSRRLRWLCHQSFSAIADSSYFLLRFFVLFAISLIDNDSVHCCGL